MRLMRTRARLRQHATDTTNQIRGDSND